MKARLIMIQPKPFKFVLNNLAVGILISCLTISVTQVVNAQSSLKCEGLFAANQKRGVEFSKVKWSDDLSYLQAKYQAEVYGQVDTFFSKKWDTQVYYTKTAFPNAKNEVPMFDPRAKAIFVFFHGSGTMKSSGRNFIANMNTLANMGYSALSIDMPFHGEGPRDPKFNEANYFMEWTKNIVTEAKKTGKPVILVGHSFGPDVILEFVTRYPKMADAVVAMSPAGFTKELSNWYDNFTSKMKFGGEVAENENGGIWAGTMSKQFLWSKKKLADPSVVNPKLNIRILSGNREEYVPAPLGGESMTPIGENTYDVSVPLKNIFKNATITVEPGIGHYLFEHADKNGFNVVLREILASVGETPAHQKNLVDQAREENAKYVPALQFVKKYAHDRIFQAWVDESYGVQFNFKMQNTRNDMTAQKILADYLLIQKERDLDIYKRILDSKNSAPAFYAKHQVVIEKLNPSRLDTSLFPAYRLYLEDNNH